MSGEDFGPNSFHRDGFQPGFLKMMVFPFGAGDNKGGVEWREASCLVKSLKGGAGTWLLFSNSSIEHRGVAPKVGRRRVIEFTLCRTLLKNKTCIVGSPSDQFPIIPVL